MPNEVLTMISVISAATSLAILLTSLLRSRKHSAAVPVLQAAIDPGDEVALRAEISGLAKRIAKMEAEHAEAVGKPVRSAMNLSKRTQALRQNRLGQGSVEIASTLDMAQAEVSLLLKVQEIVSRR